MNSIPKYFTKFTSAIMPKNYSENLYCILEENLVIIFDVEKEKLLFLSHENDKTLFSLERAN